LNTSGPVLMPWLSKVSGLLEAWYPGQQDGTAIAEVLSGAVDPSGRLPVSFPASADQVPMPSATSGLGPAVAQFGGLTDLGYRNYETRHLTPAFPFGFGLSYGTFAFAKPQLEPTPSGWRLDERVTNTARREASTVVEAYLDFPPAAGEPRQLVATATATLVPGGSSVVHLALPATVFQAWLGGHFTSLPGTYGLVVGQSLTNLTWHVRLGAPDQSVVPLLVNALAH
jgi:beta-glucosidase